MSARVLVKGCIVVALAVAVQGGRAWAGEPLSSLRDALFGRPKQSEAREFDLVPSARYRIDAGQSFTFGRVGSDEAVLKFDDDPEIFALWPTSGPRGDIIYKNDVGEPVVRATRLGGLTLFTPERPDGSAAAFVGQAPPPRPPPVLGPEALLQMMFQASAKASRAAQHLVVFDAPEVTPTSEAIFAQAFFITAEAFVRVSQHGRVGQRTLSHVVDVRFLEGSGPAAVAKGAVMQIVVAPQMGVAGRPSSERIAEVILRR